MPPIKTIPIEEMVRLYVDERMTLPQLAQRYGVSHGTIFNRLEAAGVKRRERGDRGPLIDPDEVERLYRGGEFVKDIAKRFRRSERWISGLLKARGFTNLHSNPRLLKYPALRTMEVGESVDLPIPPGSRAPHHNFYTIAAKIGIRVSANRVDDATMRVTRIDTEPRNLSGPKIPVDEMIRLRRSGETLKEIAEKSGLSPRGVAYHLAKHGPSGRVAGKNIEKRAAKAGRRVGKK